MKKTQQLNNKASFKALINIQTEKLPQKKSRSRSIRDRNNTTTNQFSISRATQQDVSCITQNNTRQRKRTWDQDENYKKKQQNSSKQSENNSNFHKGPGSMQKIRQRMRKQSQQIKEKQRNRSNSLKRRQKYKRQDNSKQNSLSKSPNSKNNHNVNQIVIKQKQNMKVAQKQSLHEIIKMKNQIKTLQREYSDYYNKLGGKEKQNSQIHLINVSQAPLTLDQKQKQLKQRSEDLNNILETFHITFNETMSKSMKEFSQKLQKYQQNRNQIASTKIMTNKKLTDYQEQEQSIVKTFINRLQTEYNLPSQKAIGHNSTKNIQNQTTSNLFKQLETKMQLAQQRLLK